MRCVGWVEIVLAIKRCSATLRTFCIRQHFSERDTPLQHEFPTAHTTVAAPAFSVCLWLQWVVLLVMLYGVQNFSGLVLITECQKS